MYKHKLILTIITVVFSFFCISFFENCNPPDLKDQSICFDFSGEKGINGWEIDSDLSWSWSSSGKAESHNSRNRPSINSISKGGAFIFNGDSLSAAGVAPGTFTLTSPFFKLPKLNRTGVRFIQYFKNYKGNCRLEIQTKTEGEEDFISLWHSFPLNRNFGDFMESLPDMEVNVDVSNVIPESATDIRVRFIYEGTGSFWIIDDVCVQEIDQLEPTIPSGLITFLSDNNYPFDTDSSGGAFPPNELVVEYDSISALSDREVVRELFQITEYENCECNETELWKSPVVLSPIKQDLNNMHFEGQSEPFNFERTQFEGKVTCGLPSGFGVVKNSQEFCEIETITDDFNQHTPDSIAENTGMLMVAGNQGIAYTLNADFKKDSLYVLSFFARSLSGIPVQLEFSTGALSIQDTLTISNTVNWARYDVLLKDSINSAPVLRIRHLKIPGGIKNSYAAYAIDDICLARYILADNIIIDVNGVIEKANSSVRVNEAEPNYYNMGSQENSIAQEPVIPPLETYPTLDEKAKVIAVLDTGVDYSYNNNDMNIRSKIFDLAGGGCYRKDIIGFNFVNEELPPYDDSRGGHGTHVTGIILQNVSKDIACDYKILPVKTHDSLSVSTLFRVSCGISYATEVGADYINASWGYYGEKSQILENVIKIAGQNGIWMFCSAGNDKRDVVVSGHWPAAYSLDNLVVIAAKNYAGTDLADFSNSGATVNYACRGEKISSSVPGHVSQDGLDEKDGTSMSTPLALSLFMSLDCKCPGSQISKSNLLNRFDEILLPMNEQALSLNSIRFIDETRFLDYIENNDICRIE